MEFLFQHCWPCLTCPFDINIHLDVKDEKKNDEHITSITKKLSELTSEICFEDTLEGSIKIFEDKAFKEIRDIIKELSKTTGKSYGADWTSFRAYTSADCSRPFFVSNAGVAYELL